MQNENGLQQAVSQLDRVRKEIAKIIVGQQDIVDGVLICLMAGGHVLLEGVPGLGKTTLSANISAASCTCATPAFSSRPTSCPPTSSAA